MANIRVDVNYTIKDGSEIVFRSPVDCTAITGLIVYYQAEDGNTTSKEFALADAHGNNVGDVPHLFAENVVVKVILDVTSGMAFVQNADTNAYLEGRFAELEKSVPGGISVKACGAYGDGYADDTAAFQTALNKNRVVFVPGGTYRLNGELVIGDNCYLELSQDTVLEFTQTSGNCIVLGVSSVINGNWATINVPYAFSGNVVYSNSADSTTAEYRATPPFKHWTPMWKSGRIVDSLNICKAQDGNGLHQSLNGDCTGTAVLLTADGANTAENLSYMWSAKIDVRIAGAFSYGIRAANINNGWNNDLQVRGYIDACEIGVSLEDCIGSVMSVFVQPRVAYSSTGVEKAYAKHGIQLIRSRAVNLNGSRVWDWDADRSLWTNGGQWQHLAMYGECKGLILDDFLYYEVGHDIRNLIYTDTPSNLEKMTILQEPIDRWFKVKGGVPYYHHDNADKKLALHEDLALFESHFDTAPVKNFTDVLPTATDTDGSIFNGIGYKKGGYIAANGIFTASGYYACTGFIPCKQGDEIHISGMNFSDGDDNCRLVTYDSSKNYLRHINRGNLVKGNDWNYAYRETDNGCVITINSVANNTQVAYARFSVYHNCIGEYPMVSINEEIKYTMAGFLADDVKVKGENVIGNVNANGLFYVDISTEDGSAYTCRTNIATLETILNAGGVILAKITTDAGALFAQLVGYETSADNSYGRIVVFALGAMAFTLTPTDSGYYEVAVS